MISPTVFFKKVLNKAGIEANLTKNLWYKDSFIVQRKILNGKVNPVIFDVGGCTGSSVQMYKTIFQDAKVYSFEPQPEAFEKLKEISGSYKNVCSQKLALSDREGEIDFFVNKSYATSSIFPSIKTDSFIDSQATFSHKIKVPVSTIDIFCRQNQITFIDILKMDVQGSELKVLEGSLDLLSAGNIRLIYSEVWFKKGYEGQPYYHDIALFLETFGYLPFGIYNMHYDKHHFGKWLWGDAIFVKDI